MRARFFISLTGLPIIAVILLAIFAAAEVPGAAALAVVLTTVLAALVAWPLGQQAPRSI